MKNKLLTLASLLAAFNLNAIEIGPTGSGVDMSGFVDMAYTERGSAGADAFSGQVELNFSFTSGPVSSAVGLDFGAGSAFGADTDVSDGLFGDENLEEAYITYDFGNGVSVTMGRMLTYMGFEAFDAPNMYQMTYAYDVVGGVQDIYDAYDYGASVDYGTDAFSVGLWSSLEENAGYEIALAFTGVENLTAKAIWSDFGDAGADAYEKSTFWVSYQLGSTLLAAEVAEADPVAGDDIEGVMLMANYAINDAAALTLRYSEQEVSDQAGTVGYDGSKFTISPSYMFTDSFIGLVEYSSYDADIATSYDEPEEFMGAEFIFTF